MERAYFTIQSLSMPPKSLNMRTRSVLNADFPCVTGAVMNMSSGVCLVRGVLGNKLLNLRRGAPTSSASVWVIAPDASCLLKRALSVRIKASRKWVYEVERVGTVWWDQNCDGQVKKMTKAVCTYSNNTSSIRNDVLYLLLWCCICGYLEKLSWIYWLS